MKHKAAVGFAIACSLWLCAATTTAWAKDRPDTWITTKVKLALMMDDLVAGTGINVDTVDGRVVLHGSVRSDAEKTRAESVARGIEGVHEVRNLLGVVPEAQQERTEAKDEDIRERVQSALEKDEALQDSNIDVSSVNAGVVYLTGEAASLSDQLRAVSRARTVPGVKRVAAEIKGGEDLSDDDYYGGGEARRERERAAEAAGDAPSRARGAASDTWITTATKTRFLLSADVPALDINVDTHDGVVTLFGSVPNQQVKTKAEAEARKVSGVREVRNQLQIVPKKAEEDTARKDDDIQRDVDRRLGKIEGADIDAEVSNGVVRLTGSVDDNADHFQALYAARATQGVRRVIDELKVQ